MPRHLRIPLRAAVLLFLLATARSAEAQDAPPITVTSSVDGKWMTADTPIDLTIDGPRPLPGRVAVMIGEVDWTALFAPTERGLRFQATTLRLPPGERPMVVYLVAPGGWQELGRFQLRVLTRGGYERVDVRPAVDVANKGQVAVDRVPEQPATPRDTFQDLTLGLGLASTFVRSGWTTTAQANVTGVTNRPEALRFGELQDEAPWIDLANYLVSTDSGKVKLSLGHVSFGSHRHLLNNFASRGAMAFIRLGTRADVALSAASGSLIVGWANPLGVTEAEHRVSGATFGVELAPRAGGARLEASVLNASLQPRADFNQGSIIDAEENSGVGLRFVATDAAQRFRFDGGFARTRFVNPDDPQLSGDATLVEAEEESRNAQYLDLAYAILQKPSASLSVAFRHELVQPLFGSLHGFVRPDVLQNVVDANGAFAGLAVQASAAWSHDNLDDLASVLKTFTRAQQLNIAAPLASLVRGSAAATLPTVTYALNHTHQFGGDVPVNSDFQATHVPDQMSTNQSVGVEWQLTKWRAGYRFNHSFQDNRQVGRAQSDLGNLTNTIAFGVAPDPRFDLGIDLAFEGAENIEISRTDATRRLSLNGSWRPTSRSTLTALMSMTTLTNDVDASESRNTDFSMQFAQTIPLARRSNGKPSAQLFVRYARLTTYAFIPSATADNRARFWTINTGVTLSLF